MNKYPRETTEYVEVEIMLDGVHTTNAIEFSLVPWTGTAVPRPDVWLSATVVDGNTVLLLQPHNANQLGSYEVWARVTDSPEIPVIDCGRITIT